MSVRLFVGNLPYSANEAEIREHFGSAGEPSQIVIPVDRETGRVRGFAFVDYAEREVAERAIKALDGQPFKGRPLSVSEARARDARPPVRDSRPPMSGPLGSSGSFPPTTAPRSEHTRNFGPNKPPRGRGGSGAPRGQQSERGGKGPLKERLSDGFSAWKTTVGERPILRTI